MKRTIILSWILLVSFFLVIGCVSEPVDDQPLEQSSSGFMPGNGEPGQTPRPGSALDTTWIETSYIDLSYGSVSESQRLDLYLPNEGDGPFPVIIEIHGGGFMFGDKSQQIAPMLEGLSRGYAVASVNYRHSGEAVFPAAVHDVKAAIRFLRAHAAEYKLNPDAFATWGGSAGGNLSAMAAISGGVEMMNNDTFDNRETSDRVQAAVDWFGPVSFDTMDAEFAELGITPRMGTTSAAGSAESKYLGRIVGSEAAAPLVVAANPATYITPDDPPMYVQHGDQDSNVPWLQSRNLSEALAAVIGDEQVTFEVIEGAAHGGAAFETEENLEQLFAFLDAVLLP